MRHIFGCLQEHTSRYRAPLSRWFQNHADIVEPVKQTDVNQMPPGSSQQKENWPRITSADTRSNVLPEAEVRYVVRRSSTKLVYLTILQGSYDGNEPSGELNSQAIGVAAL